MGVHINEMTTVMRGEDEAPALSEGMLKRIVEHVLRSLEEERRRQEQRRREQSLDEGGGIPREAEPYEWLSSITISFTADDEPVREG
jgi:hypothetical protein